MSGGRVAVVSGSGLDLRLLLDEVTGERPFHAFSGLHHTGIAGHEGAFLMGRCQGREIIVQCGRLHAYEGLTIRALGRTVDVLIELGAHTVVFTNAAGGLLPETTAGTLVAADVVWTWPFRHAPLPATLKPSLMITGCDAHGAYAWMHGPCYETRAEIRMLVDQGAATVGMSTAPEMLRCAEVGLRTAVVSCVTNHCLRPRRLTHEHVLNTARRVSRRLCSILAQNLPNLADG